MAIYQSIAEGTYIAFTYGEESNTIVIGGNALGSEQLSIQGMYGEYVAFEDREGGDLIWIDKNGYIVFTLSCELKKSTMIKIAESVFLVK